MVNDAPAFSNPRAWIHFHATFDFFYWKMSGGSCDSRSQNRSSSLPSSFSLLYHSERKLVSVVNARCKPFTSDSCHLPTLSWRSLVVITSPRVPRALAALNQATVELLR